MNGVDRYFIDTNVFLYTYDPRDPAKRDRAEAWIQWLWDNTASAVSWQVLQEFYFNAVHKFSAEANVIRDHVALLSLLNPPDVTLALLERAWFWTDQAQISFWDSMIVAAAERTHCRWLLSEDFQSGREFGSLKVVNPFQNRPGDSPSTF
jgi:predicted nucleic acid-binding protein